MSMSLIYGAGRVYIFGIASVPAHLGTDFKVLRLNENGKTKRSEN